MIFLNNNTIKQLSTQAKYYPKGKFPREKRIYGVWREYVVNMGVTIGVYDSGIGGLTTLSLLRARLTGCSFFYLADNARMPFGSKSKEEVYAAVANARKILNANCDITVFGCNTASVTTEPQEAFTLRPELSLYDPSETLVLGTPLTLSGLKAQIKGFHVADTRELAVLTEIRASLAFKSKTRYDAEPLREYIERSLLPYKGIKNVLLGCSHYIYNAELIKSITNCSFTDDGNGRTVDRVCGFLDSNQSDCNFCSCGNKCGKCVQKDNFELSKVRFSFTGVNETAKYQWLLDKLQLGYAARYFSEQNTAP